MTQEPNLAGFLAFIRNYMQIPENNLPDSAPVITVAFKIACQIVNRQIQAVSCEMYALAVYNLAADNLINYAPDQKGQSYFAKLRAKLKIGSFTAGVIEATSDESTSATIAVPDSLKNLTLSDLQNLKTPYGRQYLAIAQGVGTLWGAN